GRPGEPPSPPLNAVADYAGGTMFLLFGIMAALWERQSSGQGQIVDAAMVDGASALMALVHGLRAGGKWSDGRASNLLDGGAPFYRSYECADGRFLAVGPLEPQFFAEFCERAGAPEGLAIRQYDTSAWNEQHSVLEKLIRSKKRDEWAALFDGSDACVTPVLDWSEAARHPHMAFRDTFVEIDGVEQAAPAPRFSRSAPSMPRPPHAPGADADEILAQAGYDAEAIYALRAQGVLN
ncbi:CoA transferase, partial [Rhizobiaceae sp. 2RAB30]